MERALKSVAHLLGGEAADNWRDVFERTREMTGVSRKYAQMAAAPDRRRLEDILAEMQFALVFAGFGFQVEFEPRGKDGPDLRAWQEGRSPFHVEVMRLEQVCPRTGTRPGDAGADAALDPSYSVRESYLELVDKFEQFEATDAVVALWSDGHEIDEAGVAHDLQAFRAHAEEQSISLPDGISFVLYGSQWVSPGTRRLYCYRVRKPAENPG